MLIGCFHLQNETLVNAVQDMNQKVTNWGVGVLIMFGGQKYFPKYIENSHTYQAPESNYFIAALAIGAQEAPFKYIWN